MSDRRRQQNKGSLWVMIVMLVLIAAVVVGVVFLIKKNEASPASASEAGTETGSTPNAQVLPDTEPASEPARYEFSINTDVRETLAIETETEIQTEAENKPEITLTFAGDILFDPSYAIMSSLLARSNPPKIENGIDEKLLGIMRDSDICMVNNEFPYSHRGTPLAGKKYTFRANPEYASLMTDMGADLVSLANNHVNDYGLDAMLDTFETLEGAGVAYIGAGRNIAEASAPYYTELEGVRIAVVSATQIERLSNPDTVGATENSPGTFRCLDDTLLLERISEARENADIVIAYVHWGTESTNVPDWLQLEQAPQIAEAGADLIIGDHPHVLQPIGYAETERGRVPVVYSLGNFLFNSSTIDTCLVQATIDTKTKKLSRLQFIPAVQSGCRTSFAEGDTKTRIIDFMQSISPDITLDENGVISY